MATIAVDIDDTLYSFGQLARSTFIDLAIERDDKELQRGAYCYWGEWRSPSDVSGLDTWLEIIDRCHSRENILAQRPYDDAVDVLTDLWDAGHELLYISNRTPEAQAVTTQWMMMHNFPAGDLICTSDDKMPFIRTAQYIIDDRPKTLVQFVYDYNWKNMWGSQSDGMSRQGFGLFGEYNRSLTDVPGIWLAPNWKLLREYISDKTDLLCTLSASR